MASKKVTMKVFGMTCNDCVRYVTKGLTDGGAHDVNVSLESGIASAIVEDTEISPEDLTKLSVFGKNSQYKAQIRKLE
jgi:Copper chaperone